MGWTINFAHPLAWLFLLISFAIAVGPVLVLMRIGVVSVPVIIVALAASVFALIAFSHWEASRSRE